MKKTLKQFKKVSQVVLIAGSMTLISACIELAVATVVIKTIDIIHDRRTAGEYFDDTGIELEMRKFLIGNKRFRAQTTIMPDSYNGILLLTGESTNEDVKKEIIDYANRVNGVRQVVEEIRISGKTGLLSRANDSVITAKVKGILIAKIGTRANQMRVVTRFGTVYLMGIVSQEEADKATEITRSVGGVVRVVRVFEIRIANT